MQTSMFFPLAVTLLAIISCAKAEELPNSGSLGEAGAASTGNGGADANGGSGTKATGGGTTGSMGGAVTGGVTGTGGVKSTSTVAKGGTTGGYTASSHVPSCTDKIKNGEETDVDCGGACETKCAFSKSCAAETDCVDTIPCAEGKCTTCTNDERDGDESDVNCGGSCEKCVEGKACSARTDCATFNCTNGICGVQTNCLAVIESPCTCAENVLNTGDTAKCEAYVTCYLENECTPSDTDCTKNDGACGVNTVGGGNSPIEAAAKVYACACK